jgi:hypothetical protein
MAVFFSRDARARLYLPRVPCADDIISGTGFVKGGHVQQPPPWTDRTPRDIHPRARVSHCGFVIEMIRSPLRWTRSSVDLAIKTLPASLRREGIPRVTLAFSRVLPRVLRECSATILCIMASEYAVC